jgi:hypothetical protein
VIPCAVRPTVGRQTWGRRCDVSILFHRTPSRLSLQLCDCHNRSLHHTVNFFLLYKEYRLFVLAGQCARLLALTGTTLLIFLATQKPEVTDSYRPFLRS